MHTRPSLYTAGPGGAKSRIQGVRQTACDSRGGQARDLERQACVPAWRPQRGLHPRMSNVWLGYQTYSSMMQRKVRSGCATAVPAGCIHWPALPSGEWPRTIWVPHVGGEAACGWRVGVVLGERQTRIEKAALTA